MPHRIDTESRRQDQYAEAVRNFLMGSFGGAETKFLMNQTGRMRLAVTKVMRVFITSW
jgi:hypothetical protein